MKLLLAVLLSIILVSSLLVQVDAKQSKEASKAEKQIKSNFDKAMGKDQQYDKVCNVSVKLKDGQTLTIYNIPCTIPPPPNPPPPPPSGDKTVVCLVGDLSGSKVPNMMKGCNLKIGLGDLGYGSDLKYFKALNFNKCVIGNHDAPEDGSSSIYQEALAYCGDHWSLKIGTSTLIIGMNSNGDTSAQLTAAKTSINQQIQTGSLKTVILLSHKGGHVPPNSHHPAEAATLYSQLEQYLSPQTSVKVIEVFGHNHVSSAAPSKNWYQAGSGGKSFYSCGVDQIWTYCDNKSLSYLELTISNTDGATTAKFIN